LDDSLSKFILFGTGSGASASSAISLYEQSTAVSIPINYIAESFASINPVIEVDDKIITKHPILDLLNDPSPYYSKGLFFEVMARNYLITHESYIVGVGNISRPPLELQPISPKEVSVPEGPQGLPGSMQVSGNTLSGNYTPKQSRGKVKYFRDNLTEIKQIRGFSTRGNSLLRGQSPLLQASAEVRQHIQGNKHNVALLENGGKVSLVFNFAQHMEDDVFQSIKERVKEQYSGPANAGTIGVTAGENLTIHEMGTSNLDMDFAHLQLMAKTAVALQYKFPLPLLTTDAATMNNYKESKLALYDDAVLPLADVIFGGLTQFLMPRFGEDPAKMKITYNMDDITALAVRRNEELTLRKQLDVETDNEIRQLIGREPIDGGDVLLKPANLIPAGSDLFTADTDKKPHAARDE
jgi:HK97 family phage portal protein